MWEITSSWHFVLHDEDADSTSSWTWRRMRADGTIEQTSEPHSNFGHAVSDAIDHGFRPKTEAWVVISHGRYTQFKAGEQPIAISDDRNPAGPLNIRPSEPEPGRLASGEPVKAEVKPTKS